MSFFVLSEIDRMCLEADITNTDVLEVKSNPKSSQKVDVVIAFTKPIDGDAVGSENETATESSDTDPDTGNDEVTNETCLCIFDLLVTIAQSPLATPERACLPRGVSGRFRLPSCVFYVLECVTRSFKRPFYQSPNYS